MYSIHDTYDDYDNNVTIIIIIMVIMTLIILRLLLLLHSKHIMHRKFQPVRLHFCLLMVQEKGADLAFDLHHTSQKLYENENSLLK